MREIKFRGWDKSRKSMGGIKGWRGLAHCIITHVSLVFKGLPAAHNVPIEHVSLMQFTGLKDKTGQDIYEGDLWKLGDEVYLILWYQGDYQSGWKKKAGDNYTDIGLETATKGNVVGNIHQNSELLKEQDGT
jgi:uncharacterized phage protein (TIGR01671 family)